VPSPEGLLLSVTSTYRSFIINVLEFDKHLMFFVTGLLLFLFVYFLISGYRHNDSNQKTIAWIMLIAAFGTGMILFLIYSVETF